MERMQFEALMEVAIERENESYQFYTDVAATMKDKGVKKIFEDLALEEIGHKNLLQNYKNIPDTAMKFKDVADYKVADTIELPPLSIEMKPAEAIALAIKKEQQAVDFYNDLAQRAIDHDIKNACLELAKMETEHKVKLEDVYTDIAYIEQF
ncbi:MAG TPA: ferritin family protein [Candidatus Cloacimonadota bacterium]|nr:ferritin family protein [Candidatus Cloacimonadota bacterium]